MEPFNFEKATNEAAAVSILASDPDAAFVAGGTELLNWMKEGIEEYRHIVDINSLPLGLISYGPGGLHLGALSRMSDVASHPDVRRNYPAISEALELSASPQLRNMASVGGNILQRTRCPYFRAETSLPCNKRVPGTGCAAIHGENRTHAIFGWSESCVATHPSDLAVALTALDASVAVWGQNGERKIPITEFYVLPEDHPERETTLERGELITAISIPASDVSRRSHYLKIRERTSYEFALVSAAVEVQLDNQKRISKARIALGGVAPRPWRLSSAENSMIGSTLETSSLRKALEDSFKEARPLEQNAFKVELAKRTVVRALQTAGGWN